MFVYRWCGVCLQVVLCLSVGGVVFAPRMRSRSYRTMLDPLEEKFGSDVTALIFLSSLFGDILWTAAILVALGNFSLPRVCRNK